MKVLLDLHHLGARHTGNESWARGVSAALSSLGLEDSFGLAITDAGLKLNVLLPQGPRYSISKGSARRLLWDLPRILRNFRPDVLLVQYTAPLTEVPCVVAVHDLSFETEQARQWLPRLTRERYHLTIRNSTRRATHILALSEYTKSDLIQRYGIHEERISVAYAAVDDAFRERVTAIPRHAESIFRVLAVGNVLPRKNLAVAARALALANRRGIDAHMHVVGAVAEANKRLATHLAELAEDHISFHGYADDLRLAHAYRSADVLVFPSLYEGFGIPILEAMVAGLPVIASRATCLPEIAGDGALLASPDDPEEWCQAMLRLATDADFREALIEAGYRNAARFSWRRSGEVISEALRVAAGHRSSRAV